MLVLIALAAALVLVLVATFVRFARHALRGGMPVTRLGHAYYGYLHGHLRPEDLVDARNRSHSAPTPHDDDQSEPIDRLTSTGS